MSGLWIFGSLKSCGGRFDSSSFMVEHSDRIQHLPASEDNYTLLKKNSIKLEKSICDSLQALEKKGEINVTLRKKIAPQHSYPSNDPVEHKL